ncbi:S66 peptidase family protein [Canibacter zhoujuaniae]|uniref:S66 peptidase family protein n=1 Tax=Canibacter zhoujuaniae TaxID=2708343 RepID=UPI00142437AF|nr:LD-carboxypeptidase [Canibacter zhoujuaniae]
MTQTLDVSRETVDLRAAYLNSAPLQPGDTVAIVSPSGPGTAEAAEIGAQFYRDWGLHVIFSEHLFAKHPRASYLAGSDAVRRADLMAAWANPDVDAVVCARGGYGAMRLLDGIDWQFMRAHSVRRDGRPKLLTGSSDITALHEAWRHHLNVPTLFSPMATNDVFKNSESIRQDVQRWLFEPWGGRTLVGPQTEVLVPGKTEGTATGNFTGGNLSLLAAAIGAPESTFQSGDILFLEDIDEETYRIDNLLIQLQRWGRLKSAAGIVLGSWHDCGWDLLEVKALLAEYLSDLEIPVLWEQSFGHDPNALSTPLNVPGTLSAIVGDCNLTVANSL